MADEPEAPDDAENDGEVGITVAPSLPGLELPDYHGQRPVGMKTSLNGAGTRITRSHDLEERIVLVIEARVKKAGHESTDDGIVYVEALKAVDVFEVQGDPGRRLLSALRQAYRAGEDQGKGRRALPISVTGPDGAEVITDGSGVVLTAAELAELRGDPLGAMLVDETTPVVVVFNDGARNLWPDEFEPNEPKPTIGQRFEAAAEGEDDPDVYVAKVLHAETGETLGEWSEDDENARLLAEENALVEAEAEADRTGEDPPPPAVSTEEEEDLAFLAVPVSDIRPAVRKLDDLDRLARLSAAESYGKDRSTVIAALHERTVELEGIAREAARAAAEEE